MATPRRMDMDVTIGGNDGFSMSVTVTGGYSPDILDDMRGRISEMIYRHCADANVPADAEVTGTFAQITGTDAA